MSGFATGITIVTVHDTTKKAVGLTVNSLTSVSLDPPLVLFCLDKKAHVYPLFKKSGNFAVNILSAEQENVSRYFADYRHNPQPKNLWDRPQAGCPILRGTLGWIVCKTIKIYKGGDHDIFLAEAVKMKKTGEAEPLLYFRSRYRKIGKA
jgi:flavin reductase (DIM6/NTAB) family NADH-FMN oxidoreductase RutF